MKIANGEIVRIDAPQYSITDFAGQDVFQMFAADGLQPGFWLRRTTLDNSDARVISIGPLACPGPYYRGPESHAGDFNLTTPDLRETNGRLPAAGTYKTWRQIDLSNWASSQGTGNGSY